MLDRLAEPSRSVADYILPLYLDTTFAYALASLMALIAVALIVMAILGNIVRVSHIKRREKILNAEIGGLSGGTPKDGSSAQERQFRDDFERIDNYLARPAFLAPGLSFAWHQYRRSR